MNLQYESGTISFCYRRSHISLCMKLIHSIYTLMHIHTYDVAWIFGMRVELFHFVTVETRLLYASGIIWTSWSAPPNHTTTRLWSRQCNIREIRTNMPPLSLSLSRKGTDIDSLWLTKTWSFNAEQRTSMSSWSNQSTWSIKMTWSKLQRLLWFTRVQENGSFVYPPQLCIRKIAIRVLPWCICASSAHRQMIQYRSTVSDPLLAPPINT